MQRHLFYIFVSLAERMNKALLYFKAMNQFVNAENTTFRVRWKPLSLEMR